MSKDIARSEQSYKNEELLQELVVVLLEETGFAAVSVARRGGMKFIDCRGVGGEPIVFWLKQGWTDSKKYSAIQFGMLPKPEAGVLPDSAFIEYVAGRVASATAKGASHALMVHMVDSRITNYVAVRAEDVANAFNRQIAEWPKRARNTKLPTLYFEDTRDMPGAACATAVLDLEIPLSAISGLAPQAGQAADTAGSKKITAEIELRMQQQAFRLAVGNRCGWTCVVSGATVRDALDAAHLPGKDWRRHNAAEDGLLLRADLHRLLDRGLAELRDGMFWLAKAARVGEYRQFHERPVILTS